MLGGGGGNQHMENSICFIVFLNESFPNFFLLGSLSCQAGCVWFLIFSVMSLDSSFGEESISEIQELDQC